MKLLHEELTYKIRGCIFDVHNGLGPGYDVYGLGYTNNIYKKLLQSELSYQNIPYTINSIIPIQYKEKVLRKFKLHSPIIANKTICKIITGQDEISTDVSKMKTYLKATKLPFGILAHFGKEKLHLKGIRKFAV